MKSVKYLPHICALLFAPLSSAAVYYVDSAGGADNQNGLTPATAWGTLARTSMAPLQPGDYLLLKRGDVWRESLAVLASGSQDLPIHIGAYGTGNPPLIDGSTLIARPVDLISISSRTDIVIDGLELRNGPLNGLNLFNCARITMRNVVVSASNQEGILVFNCNLIVIEDCEVYNNSLDTSRFYDGIRIDGSGIELSGFTIRGCYIHNNIGGEGWNSANGLMLGHTGGTLPILRAVHISGSEFGYNGNPDQNQAGRGLTGTFAGDVSFTNNYVHHSASAGLYLGDVGNPVTLLIAQNVFYNNSLRQFGGNTTMFGTAFHNAIFVDNPAITAMGAEIGGTGVWQISNNSFYYRGTTTDSFRGFIRINDAPQDKNLLSDCNLFYSPGPDRWKRSDGITLTFPQWVSLGFDLNSVNPY